jgi:hypothetical protein
MWDTTKLCMASNFCKRRSEENPKSFHQHRLALGWLGGIVVPRCGRTIRQIHCFPGDAVIYKIVGSRTLHRELKLPSNLYATLQSR